MEFLFKILSELPYNRYMITLGHYFYTMSGISLILVIISTLIIEKSFKDPYSKNFGRLFSVGVIVLLLTISFYIFIAFLLIKEIK